MCNLRYLYRGLADCARHQQSPRSWRAQGLEGCWRGMWACQLRALVILRHARFLGSFLL